MSRRGRAHRLMQGTLRLLIRAGQALSLHLLSYRVALSSVVLRRRIEQLEQLQQRLRGRLVAVTAAAELAANRGDEQDSAGSEREALMASLVRLTRALAEARTDRETGVRALVSAASSRDTERAVSAMETEVGSVLAVGAGRFDTPAWEAHHRLGAGARTRATLATLRAHSPLLEFSQDLREAAQALGEVPRIGEQ